MKGMLAVAVSALFVAAIAAGPAVAQTPAPAAGTSATTAPAATTPAKPARKSRRAKKQNDAATTAAAPSTSAGKTPRKQTPGMIAAHERMKKCGAEWKQDKAAGKITKGMKWPQYWSACNKRLKASGT